METKTLAILFADKLYQIPDYQRGYAWEERQWDDFIQDIDALVDEEVRNHYTGTVVVYQAENKPTRDYGGTDKLDLLDVVDGQQRLTTCCIYLSIIVKALSGKGLSIYESKIPQYLYSGSTCKLTLSNDTKDIFHDLLAKGTANTEALTVHQKRLYNAYHHFKKHIDTQVAKRKGDAVEYLKALYDAISRKLNFTFYTIEEECQIGMTFELMNSRGKGLSILELLKNYLMYWIFRWVPDKGPREDLTESINKSWKEVYVNIGKCGGNEDQCLRTAWTIYCSHTPKYWKGYEGFKGTDYIPLRDFSKRSIQETKDFIVRFSDGLAEISAHFAVVTNPTTDNTLSKDEFTWLSKIHNTGNIANFLPLLITSRIRCVEGGLSPDEYRDVLKALECYAYRVFLFEGKRSNAGMSALFQYGKELFEKKHTVNEVLDWVYGLINYYATEISFDIGLTAPSDWYGNRRRLRYTLFEYELHLLAKDGKGKKPRLEWKDLSDSTIEHILPQNPDEQSQWKNDWSDDEIETYLHDIGNLVLTLNNSNYRNFDFLKKKGEVGGGCCYADSDIRQERQLAVFEKWDAASVTKRRSELKDWIKQRWGIDRADARLPEAVNEDENVDE